MTYTYSPSTTHDRGENYVRASLSNFLALEGASFSDIEILSSTDGIQRVMQPTGGSSGSEGYVNRKSGWADASGAMEHSVAMFMFSASLTETSIGGVGVFRLSLFPPPIKHLALLRLTLPLEIGRALTFAYYSGKKKAELMPSSQRQNSGSNTVANCERCAWSSRVYS